MYAIIFGYERGDSMTLEKAIRILSINSMDSLKTIKKKYYAMARKYHPDIYKETDAKEKMQEINLAYEYIINHFDELRSFEWSRTSTQTRYNYNKDNDKILDEILYEQYARIYGIHTEYREIREIYSSLSKGSFSQFITLELKMLLQNAMGIDIYELYSSIKNDGERIDSIERFNYVLISYALKIKDLSFKTNVKAPEIYMQYRVDTIKKSEIKFMEWLNKKINIVEDCQFFLNEVVLWNEYKKEMQKQRDGKNSKSFFEWLDDIYNENIEFLKATSLALGIPRKDILIIWNKERYYVDGENFQSWLRRKARNLNSSAANEYKKSVGYNNIYEKYDNIFNKYHGMINKYIYNDIVNDKNDDNGYRRHK